VPSGVTATFSYGGSSPPPPIAVSNGLGRTLTHAYDDDDGGDLASAVDALRFSTTFAYMPAGGPAPTGLLSNTFHPTRPGPPSSATATTRRAG